MASVRLSYGEDLQMDWDGRGRLLVKVGPFPSSSLPGANLYKVPLVLWAKWLCVVREEFLSPHPPHPQSKEQASLCMRR